MLHPPSPSQQASNRRCSLGSENEGSISEDRAIGDTKSLHTHSLPLPFLSFIPSVINTCDRNSTTPLARWNTITIEESKARTHQNMASASTSTPTLPSSERTLRWVTIVTFIPGLAFLAATGASRDYAWAYTGIAPLSLSAILALVVLVFLRGKFRKVVLALDLFLASFLLGVDIWAWAEAGRAPMVGRDMLLGLVFVIVALC